MPIKNCQKCGLKVFLSDGTDVPIDPFYCNRCQAQARAAAQPQRNAAQSPPTVVTAQPQSNASVRLTCPGCNISFTGRKPLHPARGKCPGCSIDLVLTPEGSIHKWEDFAAAARAISSATGVMPAVGGAPASPTEQARAQAETPIDPIPAVRTDQDPGARHQTTDDDSGVIPISVLNESGVAMPPETTRFQDIPREARRPQPVGQPPAQQPPIQAKPTPATSLPPAKEPDFPEAMVEDYDPTWMNIDALPDVEEVEETHAAVEDVELMQETAEESQILSIEDLEASDPELKNETKVRGRNGRKPRSRSTRTDPALEQELAEMMDDPRRGGKMASVMLVLSIVFAAALIFLHVHLDEYVSFLGKGLTDAYSRINAFDPVDQPKPDKPEETKIPEGAFHVPIPKAFLRVYTGARGDGFEFDLYGRMGTLAERVKVTVKWVEKDLIVEADEAGRQAFRQVLEDWTIEVQGDLVEDE